MPLLSMNPYENVVGRTLNKKWKLEGLLGVGGSAAVYSARHRNGNAVAVKILHRELSVSPDLVARFLREGYLANRIDHPGVVTVLDDDRSEDGLVYIVMERLVGMSLDERLRGSAMPLPDAVGIVGAVLDVLAAAHAVGIVHRDIKPENIFLLDAGGVKVLDFGIAKAAESPGGAPVTQMGLVFGSLGFMPPEQARGQSDLVDGRTDLWAVGATLYTMLTGRRLHDAPTPHESLLLAMTEAIPPMADLAPTLPRDVARVLDGALAWERDARWPDARAMQLALRAADANAGACDPPAPKQRVDSTVGRAAFAIVLALVAALAFAAFVRSRRVVTSPSKSNEPSATVPAGALQAAVSGSASQTAALLVLPSSAAVDTGAAAKSSAPAPPLAKPPEKPRARGRNPLESRR